MRTYVKSHRIGLRRVRRAVLATVIGLIGCFGVASTTSGWVFRGQPKEGAGTYETTQAERANRAQQAVLLDQCDKGLAQLPAPGVEAHLDTETQKAVALALDACGLIFGIDHQREKAVQCFERALILSTRLGDLKQKGKILCNLGIVHGLWGQGTRALKYFEQAIDASAGSGDLETQAQALNHVGQIYMFWSQYKNSLERYQQSLALFERHPHAAGASLLMDNLGLLYETWGQNAKAIECYEKGMAMKKQAGLTGGEAASCMLLGRTYYSSGDFLKAMNQLEQGVEICTKHGYPADNFYDVIGNIFLEKGKTESAEEYLKKGGFWSSLGRLCLVKSEYEKAREYYEKLHVWATPRQIPDYLFIAETGLGTVCEGLEAYPEAAEHFQKAVDLAEEQRARLGVEERLEFLQVRTGGFRRTAPYEGLARVLIKMKNPVKAFEVSEYSKARTFAETLAMNHAGLRFDVPAEVLEEDAKLNGELAVLQRERMAAYQDGNRELSARLELNIRAVKAKLNGHIRSLREKYPLFAATRYPQPMELDQMRLHDHEWVLSYDVTDMGIITYLTRGNELVHSSWRPVARKDLDELVRACRSTLEISSNEDISEKLKRFDLASARKLSELLLADVLGKLPRDVPVIIVPDDSLGVLPFEMLLLSSTGRVMADKSIPYLVEAEFFCDRNPISYYHSVTALTVARSLGASRAAPDKALVLADPVFHMSDLRAEGLRGARVAGSYAQFMVQLMAAIQGSEAGKTLFARLPFTQKLAESLRGLYKDNAEVLTGLDATKNNFFQRTARLSNDYGTIVFATHGYVGTEIPGIMEPVLVLSLVPIGADGFIRMSEVMGLKLGADLVALTACQTGLGRTVSGEGVMGMGRAFQYAGARSVLMSLWSVAEAPAVMLVESFFKHLRAGRTKSDALHLARTQLREHGYNHPFFWAAFIVVGETR